MHDFAIFKGNCPPQEDVALANSLTYFAHYRHEPELKDKLMDIFIRCYENNYVLRSDFDVLCEYFPKTKNMFEEIALEFVDDEDVSKLDFDSNGDIDVYTLLKNDANDNSGKYYYSYLDLLLLFEMEEYERVSSPREVYHINATPQLTIRSYEKYASFLRCLYSYMSLVPQRRDNYIIFVPNSMAPVQLLDTALNGMDPFHDDYPKGIKVNPCDYIVYNWDYGAFSPDFYAIQQLIISRELGESYVADPATKTYAVQISQETFEYAQERLRIIQSDSNKDVPEAELNLLTDIVEAYHRDHEKFDAVYQPLRIGPSSVDKVPTYWACIRLRRILQPELKRIREEIDALQLNEIEKERIYTERLNKLTEDYIRKHSTFSEDGKLELRIEDDYGDAPR